MRAVPKTGHMRGEACRCHPLVIPAKAGIQFHCPAPASNWIPAFAGMTAGQADMTAGALSPP